MTNQIVRRLEALERSMDADDGVPRFDFTIVFVGCEDGKPTGQVKRVKLSDLPNSRCDADQR